MYNERKSNKPLGIFTLVMINIIAIDSLRNLPANAASGYSILSYYLIAAALFLLPCGLVTAKLASKYPERGGVYVWVREAFGKPTAFFTIWLQWIYNVVWYPSILLFIATNIAYLVYPELLNHHGFQIPKLFLIVTITLLFLIATTANSLGMLISGLLSNLSAIIGTLLPMAILIIIGVDFWHHHSSTIPTINHFLPFHGHKNHLALLSIVIFSLMGLEMSAVHAKEVKKPQSKSTTKPNAKKPVNKKSTDIKKNQAMPNKNKVKVETETPKAKSAIKEIVKKKKVKKELPLRAKNDPRQKN